MQRKDHGEAKQSETIKAKRGETSERIAPLFFNEIGSP
jgi:hypothetical protein